MYKGQNLAQKKRTVVGKKDPKSNVAKTRKIHIKPDLMHFVTVSKVNQSDICNKPISLKKHVLGFKNNVHFVHMCFKHMNTVHVQSKAQSGPLSRHPRRRYPPDQVKPFYGSFLGGRRLVVVN